MRTTLALALLACAITSTTATPVLSQTSVAPFHPRQFHNVDYGSSGPPSPIVANDNANSTVIAPTTIKTKTHASSYNTATPSETMQPIEDDPAPNDPVDEKETI